MNLKKKIVVTALSLFVAAGSYNAAYSMTTHTVQQGDTFWKISQTYKIPLDQLLAANNANQNTMIYIGQRLIIPSSNNNSNNTINNNMFQHTVVSGDTYWNISQRYRVNLSELLRVNNAASTNLFIGQRVNVPIQGVHTAKSGDTYWIISRQYGVDFNSLLAANSATTNSSLAIGQQVIIPLSQVSAPSQPSPSQPSPSPTPQTNTKIIINHTVRSGDNFWNLGIQYGVPMNEILQVNGFTQNTSIFPGQVIKVPQYQIAVKPTPGPQFGELLDWWTEAQYVWPIGKEAAIIDFATGLRWNVRRTIGANHADVEPLTQNDTNIMRSVWGGQWSWATRPVIVVVDGRRLAASANGMPHSIQHITNNGFNGHFCVHFHKSTTHGDGKEVVEHQNNVLKAAGRK